ncbi:hypothetical protein [Shimia aestuarii]|uniref:Uncharacterized protein n=1 Tax=Shimia aestuarii TaxID=254406 RepID=A0A1I4PEL4_9RHOB|nr:hypothetical protein [Shimia aestuarii]SFM26194.1 hypothetical protein SAMN04488042_105206 [Shimia aestuarii]
MSDISDLENRISAAMDRIGRGIEALSSAPAAAPSDGEAKLDQLERALEDEKLAGQQLEERIKALTGRQEALESDLGAAREAADAAEAARAEAEAAREKAEQSRAEAEAALEAAQTAAAEAAPAVSEEDLQATRETMEDLAQRLRRMRRMTRNIRENNQRLREAAEKGVSDPELINASLRTELETLQTLRETDLVETDVILSGLRPLLAGQKAAPAQDGEVMGDG